MGGVGSGTWVRDPYRRKPIVEESLVVSMAAFRGRILKTGFGFLEWTWNEYQRSSVHYELTIDDGPMVVLTYGASNGRDLQRTIVRLQSTQTQFEGRRWWFSCPLMVNGMPCGRRSAKLYLPYGCRYFGCRACHNLTYESSREAHHFERRLAAEERKRGFLEDEDLVELLSQDYWETCFTARPGDAIAHPCT